MTIPEFDNEPSPRAARLFRKWDLLWLALILLLAQVVPGILTGMGSLFFGSTILTDPSSPASQYVILVAVTGSGLAMFIGIDIMRRRRHLAWRDLGIRPTTLAPCAVAVLLFLIYIILDGYLVKTLELDPDGTLTEELAGQFISPQSSLLQIALAMLSLGIMVPIAEELLFRGMVLRWLQERTGAGAAIAISSLLFATVHFYFLVLDPGIGLFVTGQIFVLGLLLGWLYVWSRSIWPPIVLHVVNNLATVAIAVWGTNF
ncbi:MAG: type II CAAX endopeptidase family protein [Dongiaceae bacterium]